RYSSFPTASPRIIIPIPAVTRAAYSGLVPFRKNPSITPHIPSNEILTISILPPTSETSSYTGGSMFQHPSTEQKVSGCSQTDHRYTERSRTALSEVPKDLPERPARPCRCASESGREWKPGFPLPLF